MRISFVRRHRVARFAINVWAVALAALCVVQANAQADKYPDRPLKLVVGFAPGGAADTVARVIADELGKQLGKPIVVDNRTGASGNIASQAAIAAPADGLTLMFAGIQLATNPAIMVVGYDPLKDVQMIAQFNSVPVVMVVRADSPLRTIPDVVAAMRKTEAKGGLTFASGGIGTSSHLAAELLARVNGVPYVHVPFRGGALATQALLGGEVNVMFDLMSGSLKSMVDAGKVRLVAVMQGSRVATLPDVPAAAEQGLKPEGFIRTWQGLAVRSGTPPEIVARLHSALTAAVRSPAVADKFRQLGMETTLSASPAEAQRFYLGELERWTSLIKAAGIKAE